MALLHSKFCHETVLLSYQANFMPKRTDLKSILIIGAGPIVIGQACEFDYSGTQACKALRNEGYKVILVNSNPATIMTDPNIADRTYIEPITPEVVETIIAIEKPCALLPTVGGQTALNCALALAKNGVLAKHNVELIGASIDAIKKAEDRALFQQAMDKIGLSTPKNKLVNSLEQAKEALAEIGLPAIIRPSFTMGGAGGGVAYTVEEYLQIIQYGLSISPVKEVLIDKSIIGWKEYEMEVVRDKNDNGIIICSIENIDPMGVHTGDSITVAPALTLTDKEYQHMRNASLAVLREIGVETGGANVQFAVNPENGQMTIIEMNPRVSRSSALASKATGFPIAKVAAKLAVGFTLDEISNEITNNKTPASFEPTIDYIVTKIPKFTFEKFKSSTNVLSSSMKSVGEVMAIGRCFAESLQKALRSLENNLSGLEDVFINSDNHEQRQHIIKQQLKIPASNRLLVIAQAFREGLTATEINQISNYDPWFLEQIHNLVQTEKQISRNGIPNDPQYLFSLKKQGFSDKRIAKLCNASEQEIRLLRYQFNIHPIYKRVDSCSAEFATTTSYFYSTYE